MARRARGLGGGKGSVARARRLPIAMLAYVSDPSKCLIILANARGGSTHPIMDCRVLALEAWLALAASAASTIAPRLHLAARVGNRGNGAKQGCSSNGEHAADGRHDECLRSERRCVVRLAWQPSSN